MVHAQCRQKLSLAYLLAASPLRHQPIHSLILGAKFHGLQSAALILAHLCIQSLDRPHLAEVINPRTTLCAPIPMHTIKENYRGYNQASLMAREIAKKLHLTYADLLTCRRPIRDQMKLPKLERFKNLSHAFTAAIPIPEKIQTILLVDDVITTGATMISAATTLSQTILRPLTIIGVAAAYNDSRNY